MDYKTSGETNPKLSSEIYPETYALMNPAVYTQNDSGACVEMLEAGARMLAEMCARMYPEIFVQITDELCAELNPESCVQMNQEVCAKMNSVVCAKRNPVVCAIMNKEDCAKKKPVVGAKMDNFVFDKMNHVVCAKMNPVLCAKMNHVGCTQTNPATCGQTDQTQVDNFQKGYTGSTDIERDIERTHPSVVNRIMAARQLILNNQQIPVERELSCPVYAFSADLVRYVMMCYFGSQIRNSFEFTDEFAHSSPIKYFNDQIAFFVRIVVDDRQELIHATYAQCFPYALENDVKREALLCRMEMLQIAVEIGYIRSTVDLLNLCIFVAHFCAIAYADGIHSAKYMALDTVYWNMVQFVRIILCYDSKYFWQIMPKTCLALASEVKDRKLFDFLCDLMLNSAKMLQDRVD